MSKLLLREVPALAKRFEVCPKGRKIVLYHGYVFALLVNYFFDCKMPLALQLSLLYTG